MKNEYNFSKSVKNPYAKHLKKQVRFVLALMSLNILRIYFGETGVPYQNLINLYFQDCAHSHKKLKLNWVSK